MRNDPRQSPAKWQPDEDELAALVDRSYPVMARIAATLNASQAEDSIVAAWSSAIAGATSLEALKIAVYRALLGLIALRDQVSGSSGDGDELADQLEAKRYGGARSRWPGFWRSSPRPLADFDDDGGEALALTEKVISNLPLYPRVVVLLRDFDGWSAENVSQLLGVDLRVQRALLKSGREQVVRALGEHSRGTRV